MKRASSISFALFVIVVLAALYSLLAGHGKTNWGLVTVLAGILLLRVGLFAMNLRQQRRNVVRGRGPVRIETRLGLNDDLNDDSNDEHNEELKDSSSSDSAAKPGGDQPPPTPPQPSIGEPPAR